MEYSEGGFIRERSPLNPPLFLEGENPSTFAAWVLSLQTSLFPKHDLGLRPKNLDAAQGASGVARLKFTTTTIWTSGSANWLRYKKFTTTTVWTPHRELLHAILVARAASMLVRNWNLLAHMVPLLYAFIFFGFTACKCFNFLFSEWKKQPWTFSPCNFCWAVYRNNFSCF